MTFIRNGALLALLGLALAACGTARAPHGPAPAANPYLWAATLDVLGFLPLQSADPATGTITTGFGTAPGGSRPYRAQVQVAPALDARSLSLSLQTPSGPATAATRKAVADAIFLRARQLRIAGSGL